VVTLNESIIHLTKIKLCIRSNDSGDLCLQHFTQVDSTSRAVIIEQQKTLKKATLKKYSKNDEWQLSTKTVSNLVSYSFLYRDVDVFV